VPLCFNAVLSLRGMAPDAALIHLYSDWDPQVSEGGENLALMSDSCRHFCRFFCSSRTRYEVYFSPKGQPFEFVLEGDGGFINWAYIGNFNRNDHTLTAT
jgi:hypothetical protein